MRSLFDFPDSENSRLEKSRQYDWGTQNQIKAWTVLTSIDNLRDILATLWSEGGNYLGDGEKFQLNIVWRCLHAAESSYWLVKYHQYSAAYGRCRYLLEAYLILKNLNQNKSEAESLWQDYREETKRSDSDYRKIVESAADILADNKSDAKKKLGHLEKEYKSVYSHLSNRGSHPHSLLGVAADGNFTPDTEGDIFTTVLDLLFGVAAQIIRTVEDTDIRWEIHELVDHVIVEIKLAHPSPPIVLLRDEMKFWSPSEFM